MKEKIKSVTLKLSQEGASYLQNGSCHVQATAEETFIPPLTNPTYQ